MSPRAMRGRTALVTGGDGLIGSHLCRELLAHGADVVVIRRDRPPLSGLSMQGIAGRVHAVCGDVRDDGLVARTLNEYAP